MEDNNNGEKKGDEDQKVSFFKLFSFADKFDVALMIIGTIGAIGNGLTQPLMTLIFGQLVNSFGSSNSDEVVHKISKVSFYNKKKDTNKQF
ncbi:hypothetical protein H5410_007448 [Solanum commersonii]|uniref:Uncharacterized protein n=1 Tax=Solanum commersonii TaxID=4109 RepID=A0A9J6AC10_SOLCO|nr:hypothetical protein H5410_007448 [Solanum commersonii]